MLVWGLKKNIFFSHLQNTHSFPWRLHIPNKSINKALERQAGQTLCRRKWPEREISRQWINSRAQGPKFLFTQSPSVYPGSEEETHPLHTPSCSHASAEHQILAPCKFRAEPELVTLVVIVDLKLQLCLESLPARSKLGFSAVTPGLLLPLLLELLSVTVGTAEGWARE